MRLGKAHWGSSPREEHSKANLEKDWPTKLWDQTLGCVGGFGTTLFERPFTMSDQLLSSVAISTSPLKHLVDQFACSACVFESNTTAGGVMSEGDQVPQGIELFLGDG